MDGRRVYVDGCLRPVARACVSALDRGFTLGDGLFETMRARGDRVLFLDEHLARLREGAATLGLPPPPDADLRAAIALTLADNRLAAAVARLTVTRGRDLGRGLDPPTDPRATVVVRAAPFAPPAPRTYHAGVAAVVSAIRRNESSPLSRLKSCNYGDNVLARREARDRGAAEALLLNTAGDVACATAGNVLAVINGRLHTPPGRSGVLPGVTRRAVLDVAAQLGLPAVVEPFDLEALRGASEAFLTNTVVGVMPLTRLDGRAIGDGVPGPLTRALGQAYNRLVERHLG